MPEKIILKRWTNTIGCYPVVNILNIKNITVSKRRNQVQENGIEIPFPQTDLHIKSIGPEVAAILKGKANQ